jgi:hypothetical protein
MEALGVRLKESRTTEGDFYTYGNDGRPRNRKLLEGRFMSLGNVDGRVLRLRV